MDKATFKDDLDNIVSNIKAKKGDEFQCGNLTMKVVDTSLLPNTNIVEVELEAIGTHDLTDEDNFFVASYLIGKKKFPFR